MSVHAMANVWATSRQTGGNLLLLLALADYANDAGECWPAVETVARKARLTERHARRILRELEAEGEIECRPGGGRNRVNVYVIRCAAENPDRMTGLPKENPDTDDRVKGGNPDTDDRVKRRNTDTDDRVSKGETRTKATETRTSAAENPDAGAPQTIMNHQEPSPSEVSELDKDAAAFVDWFLDLLKTTGARVPKLTAATRDGWADTYEKLVRIDGRTKKDIARVCRWAREDSFWRSNFLSPMKLRHKNRDGVMYFDVFANRMQQPHENDKGSNSRRLGAHSNIAALEAFAERRRGVAPEA